MADNLEIFGLKYNNIQGIKAVDENGYEITYTRQTIEQISSGLADVVFYDYDGTILYEYTAAEFLALSAMPANPTHTGLTAQGWNWTLTDAKNYVNAYGMLDIGQMYVTASGKTEIDIVLDDELYLSPYLCCSPNGTVTIDWGDNSTNTVTGTSLTTKKATQHTYATKGSYTITLTATSGSYGLIGASGYGFFGSNTTVTSTSVLPASAVYSEAVKHIRLGNNVSIQTYAFAYLVSVETITIPQNIVINSSGAYIFGYTYKIKHINMPSGTTGIGANYTFAYCSNLKTVSLSYSLLNFGTSNAFYYCRQLLRVTIPPQVQVIYDYAFNYCRSLKRVVIPYGVTTIKGNAFSYSGLEEVAIPSSVNLIDGQSIFQDCTYLKKVVANGTWTEMKDTFFSNCNSLKEVSLPNTVTKMSGGNIFNACYLLEHVDLPNSLETIGSNMFTNSYNMKEITIPANVTSMGSSVFGQNYNLVVHMKPTTPPTITSSSLGNFVAKITVPQGCLSAYQSATNWSTYASRMAVES